MNLRYSRGKEQEAPSLKKIQVKGHRNMIYGEIE